MSAKSVFSLTNVRKASVLKKLKKRPGPLLGEYPLVSPQEAKQRKLQMFERELEGMRLLLEYYGISTKPDGSHWFELSWEMAHQFFPYFSYGTESSGRKRRWTRKEKINLWVSVEMGRRLFGKTLDDACAELLSGEYSGMDIDSLKARYKEATQFIKLNPDIPAIRSLSRIFRLKLKKGVQKKAH